MPTKEIERVLYKACVKALELLGPDLKGMSCFLPNWGLALRQQQEEQQEAA